jgi:hypothetical protein
MTLAQALARQRNNGMTRQFSASEVRAADAILRSGGPGAAALQRSLANQMIGPHNPNRSLRGT